MEWKGTREGFTFIEIAVVLVIIGLIVGGLLVGRDPFARRECEPKSRKLRSTTLR